MSKYVDADKLIEHITNTADLGGWIGEALQQIKKVAIKYINLAPSIDIVRCGECKYWKNSLCKAWHRVIPKDGYCSIGERSSE